MKKEYLAPEYEVEKFLLPATVLTATVSGEGWGEGEDIEYINDDF